MAPTSEPPRSQPLRRKSKPKFEIPAEAGLPQTAGWVYRASDVPAGGPAAKKVSAEKVQARPVPARVIPVKPVAMNARAVVQEPVTLATASPAAPQTEPLWTAGFDLVALGFSTMQRTATGTLHVLSAPIRRARRLLI